MLKLAGKHISSCLMCIKFTHFSLLFLVSFFSISTEVLIPSFPSFQIIQFLFSVCGTLVLHSLRLLKYNRFNFKSRVNSNQRAITNLNFSVS